MLLPYAAILLSGLCVLGHTASDICYNPDGTQTENDNYQPCLPSANITHCCLPNEICLKNGLCLFANSTSLNTGLCTDSTWLDCFPRCLKPQRRPGPSTVYRCNNDLWCCSVGVANSTSCCQDEEVDLFPIIAHAIIENGTAFLQGYSIAPLGDIITDGSAPTVTSTQTRTLTRDVFGSPLTITAIATSTPPALPKPQTSVQTKALLATGWGVGGLMLVVVGVLFLLLLREKRSRRATKEARSGTDDYGYPLVPKYELPPGDWLSQSPSTVQRPAEIYASESLRRRIEADSRGPSSSRTELPGS